jgi:ferric iron reductase protein FhuF
MTSGSSIVESNVAAASLPLDLSRWWLPPLAELSDSIHFGAPRCGTREEAVPADRLTDHLDTILATMREHYCGDDARALVSQWSKWYFKAVLPAAVAHAVIARRPLTMPLASSTLVLKDGLPHGLWLPEDSAGSPVEDAAARYRSLCSDHLAPLIDSLSAAVRMAPRVLWSNAGNLLEYVMSLLMQMPDHAETARADSSLLFGGGDFFGTGERNPLRMPVRYVTPPSPRMEDPFRVRRICCLRDRLPGEGLCSGCPLLLTMRTEALEQYLNDSENC